MDVFDLFAKISLDTSEYESGLNDASNKTSSFSDTLQSIGSTVSSVGTTLTNGISRPLLDIGKNILQAGMDYEAGMDAVAAISSNAGEHIDELGAKAMEMASKTKFSTAESAEAYKYMAMAGWDAEDMLNAISAVMYLAGASGESLASTSDIVTDAMTAFGLAADGSSKVLKDGYMVEVSNAQRFTDVLAAASNNANTNVSMLGESFKFVAPVAGSMGYSVEDVAVALGLMANNGIKASMGGTALRTLLVNMSNPTDAMAAAMDALGVSLADDEGRVYSLLEVLEQLRAGFGGGKMDSEEFAASLSEIETAFESGELSEEDYEAALNDLAIAMYGAEGAQNAQLAAMLAGKYGMAGLLAIVNTTDEDFQKLTESIYNSNGATEEMYGVMTDNAQGAVDMLDSAINVLYTSLSEHIIPAFTSVVEKITDAVNWFGSLDDETQKLILTIGGIAIAAGPVLTIIGNIITAIGIISGGISGLIGFVGKAGSAFTSFFSILAANPIALVIAAVAALVAGFVVLWNTSEDFRNFWIGLWETVKSAASTAVDVIVGFFSGFIDFIADNWQNILLLIVNPFVGAFKLIYDNCEAFREFIDGILETIEELFESAGEAIMSALSAAWEDIQGAWSVAVDFFASIGDGIISAFSAAAETVSAAFSAAWNAIVSAWSVAVSFFAGLWENIKAAIAAAADSIWNALVSAWNAITSAWDAATSFFSGIVSSILGVFANIGSSFMTIGSNIVNGIKSGITNAWTAFVGWISSKIGGLVDTVKNLLGIHSPSTVFAGIGENMALGLGEGWNDEYDGIKKQIANGLSFDAGTVGITANGSYNTSGMSQNGLQAGFGGAGNTYVTINSPEAVDAVTAAREWKKTTQRMAMGYV